MTLRVGGRAMPPAMKRRFLPSNCSIGKRLPYGTSEGHDVARVGVGERRSHAARLAEGAFDVLLAGLRAGDAEGAFALAEDAVQAEHAGFIVRLEEIVILLFDEFELERVDAGGFSALRYNPHRERAVDHVVGMESVLCHLGKFEIACRVSVIPISTGHWRVQRPQPVQLLTPNLPW